MFYEIKEEIRNKLTLKDIRDILISLGSAEPKERNDCLIFQTVCHHNKDEDMSYKLYYYINDAVFKCYTGEQKSYDIYGLVQDTLQYRNINVNLEQSIEYVVNNSNLDLGFGISSQYNNSNNFDWDFVEYYKRAVSKAKEGFVSLEKIDSNKLGVYRDYYYLGWLKEGICVDAMKKFNIKYSLKDNRVVIPHYDIFNNLIGIRGRSLRKEEVEGGYKYMPMEIQNKLYAHPTSASLYGIYRNKKIIRTQRQVVLFESEKSVLKAESLYPDNNYTLALAGKSISDNQIKLLLKLNVNRVILAFDRDYKDFYSDKGFKCYENMKSIGKALKAYFNVHIMVDDKFLLDEGDSPIDKGKKVFEKLYNRKIKL